MSPWQSGEIAAGDLRLHYTRTGGAKPPVVLAHGVTDSGLCWTRVAEALAADYDVVMVDARGHGRSSAPDRDYGPAVQAGDLAGVIEGLGLDRPAVLGHSMGAATTLMMAGQRPGLPGAILLEDPPAWWAPAPDASPARAGRQARMREWIAGLGSRTREELIAEQRAQTPGWSDAELEPWADAKLTVSPNVLEVFDSDAPARVDWPATLRRISCPALLITGDPDRGAIVTEESAAALRALVPHVEVVHIPEAGHNIRREGFDRYMEVVRAFLSKTRRTA